MANRLPPEIKSLLRSRPCPEKFPCYQWAGGDFDHPNMNPDALCGYCYETYRVIIRYWRRRNRNAE